MKYLLLSIVILFCCVGCKPYRLEFDIIPIIGNDSLVEARYWLYDEPISGFGDIIDSRVWRETIPTSYLKIYKDSIRKKEETFYYQYEITKHRMDSIENELNK